MHILESMRESKLSFCEAALQLQLITSDDIQEVTSRLRGRQPGGRQGGLIEAAIRRASERRDVTVRQGEAHLSTQLRHVLDSDDPRSEKIRALRTELMLLGDSTQRGTVLALVGPDRGDGRSSAAVRGAGNLLRAARPPNAAVGRRSAASTPARAVQHRQPMGLIAKPRSW